MDIQLTIRLLFSLFSFHPQNMRWFNVRRILISVFLLPLFTVLLVVNRVFMLLDYLFFPFFINQQIKDPVFIVAAPRSATTYLFHLLASREETFTSFRLWEIVFAPSILQKYFVLIIRKLDRMTGSPLWKLLQLLEAKLFGKFKHIHLIGLNMPEEDEAILLWNMSTIYLNFFFPETKHFEKYEAYDVSLSRRLSRRNNRYYLRCIKRHVFVFNRNGEKRFLSKNPAMMSKVKSLHELFPDAVILNINRDPAKVIPSTLALNETIYRFFTSHRPSADVNKKTMQVLIRWYQMAHENLNRFFPNKFLEIDFDKLTKNDSQIMDEISSFLKMGQESLAAVATPKSEKIHKSKNTYTAMGADERLELLQELPFLSKYCNEIAS